MSIPVNSLHHTSWFVIIILAIMTFTTCPVLSQSKQPNLEIKVHFDESGDDLTYAEKTVIQQVISSQAKEAAAILEKLPASVIIRVQIIDRDLQTVDGVTGWTNEHDPIGRIVVLISKVYPGGPLQAAKDGMKTLIFHEFHHLTRGWSIKQNEYAQGIDNALINEGLAVVFAEEYTGIHHEVNAYPEEAQEWVEEILELPKDANYSHWVSGEHPDGRKFIGYRTGNYVIRKAMKRSGKSVLELSELSPSEIFEMAGYS
ncbi:MAG: DUF2268 domain-containing putative Zn-dependent protease [Balneola sp.]|jgi:hypothetical protein|uniref:DUF2268 domain-containing putative Zn-dependent protease n=1 Tax=Balneola sp. EhC07 TaxID=1849360 RepID=UPI0007F53151|nr:DUF2268 domain-containing putative Zn-dependent protease [Balneola sp. EhC07]OAN62443.1 hypothetical protein A8B79_02510 [Balneola sp. EhC07]